MLFWKLRYRTAGHGPVSEQSFDTESGFRTALQGAYSNRATDLAATTPESRVLTEAVLRKRFPPEMDDGPRVRTLALNLTEHAAAQQAMIYLRANDPIAALDLLRGILIQSVPPADAASDMNGRLLLRAYFGQAIVEIVEGFPLHALRTLEAAVEGTEPQASI